jgi:hypothetical protein
MTIIIKHLKTGNEYLLLETSLSVDKTLNPSRFLGDFFPAEEEGKTITVAACDVQGRIFRFYAIEVVVITIDGKKLSELLPEAIATPTEVIVDNEENGDEEAFEDDEEWL